MSNKQNDEFYEQQLELIKDPEQFTDPLDALVYLTQAVGGDEVRKYLMLIDEDDHSIDIYSKEQL